MKSTVQEILDQLEAGTITEAQAVTQLMQQFKKLFEVSSQGLMQMRHVLVSEDRVYNSLMDANESDNPESHYAKTMMLYGRKFCGLDIINGVTINKTNPSSSEYDERYSYEVNGSKKYYITPPLPSLKSFFTQFCPGKLDATAGATVFGVEVEWNCWDSNFAGNDLVKNTYYRPNDGTRDWFPAEEKLTEYHALGTVIQMPKIKDFDRTSFNNDFQLKSGYRINGWKLANNDGSSGSPVIYLVDDYGDNWKMKQKATSAPYGNPDPDPDSRVKDLRVFEKPDETTSRDVRADSAFILPFMKAMTGSNFPNKVKFVLDISATKFQIGFKIPHLEGKPASGAYEVEDPAVPAYNHIITMLGQQIKLPLATLIVLASGWEIDTDNGLHPYGQWTTVIPGAAHEATGNDAYGVAIPKQEIDCGSERYVGPDLASQLDASTNGVYVSGHWEEENKTLPIKWLYLKVKASS